MDIYHEPVSGFVASELISVMPHLAYQRLILPG